MFRKYRGFTLIELVIVIVLLGILAATALPKFADLGQDARVSAVQSMKGSIQSAVNIVHAAWYAQGQSSTVNLDSSNTVHVNSDGWPDLSDGSQDTADELFAALMTTSLADDPKWSGTVSGTASATFTFESRANCTVLYTVATGKVTATTTGC